MKIEYVEYEFNDDDDLNKIAKIHAGIPRNRNPEFIVTNEMIERVKGEIEECKKKSLGYCFLLAKLNDEIIGFHWLDKRIVNGKEAAHIRSLEVLKEHRNKGIGKKLKDLGEEWAKKVDAKFIQTKVSYDNAYMIEYNIKRGFKARKVEMIKELK